ncbi:MAG TPA: phage antirepressor N-terminal domain-containing protein [Roseiflexaceae bacterium]|nr:phage antirepressor N-terminal domain-containing protein [Roseiflexaceae bacterium]
MYSSNHGPPPPLFPANDIFAALELDPNQRYVPVPHLCSRLGLPPEPQERRTRAHSVLSHGARLLDVDTDEGQARQLCVRIDLVPMLLLGIEAVKVDPSIRLLLEQFQAEAASALWQNFRPQGVGPEDGFVPERHQQNPAEQAYVAEHAMATLARHQVLIERQLDTRALYDEPQGGDPYAAAGAVDDAQAELLARAVRRVALAAQERTRRNEYPGMFTGLFRQFGIASYRRMPPARLREALEWLDRWRGDLMGEPEPPPDI